MSDTKSPIPAPRPTCPLLMLPPEIRNRIWTLVVKVGPITASRHNLRLRKQSGKNLAPATISLAFTCRQVYREVTPIYYSENLFIFPCVTTNRLLEFAEAIGSANAESIIAVEVLGYSDIQTIPYCLGKLKERVPFPNLIVLLYSDLHHTHQILPDTGSPKSARNRPVVGLIRPTAR